MREERHWAAYGKEVRRLQPEEQGCGAPPSMAGHLLKDFSIQTNFRLVAVQVGIVFSLPVHRVHHATNFPVYRSAIDVNRKVCKPLRSLILTVVIKVTTRFSTKFFTHLLKTKIGGFGTNRAKRTGRNSSKSLASE